jgi:hypothetical protein
MRLSRIENRWQLAPGLYLAATALLCLVLVRYLPKTEPACL